MPQQSQEDQKIRELIKDFQSYKTVAALRQWEKSNRDVIKTSPWRVKEHFDTHWAAVTGENYFLGITDIDIPRLQQKQRPGRINPKETDYKTERIFSVINWKKTTYARGKGSEKEFFENYEISGIHSEDNRYRLIAKKCTPDQIQYVIGEELAEKILSSKKKSGKLNNLNHPVMIEGHWEVMFSEKSSKWEKEDVEIQHEGRCLQIQRGVPVILPGKYIEVNDNARHPVFMKSGDQPRKIIGWVQHFPSTTMREATELEYRQQKEEGDRITRMAREREEML